MIRRIRRVTRDRNIQSIDLHKIGGREFVDDWKCLGIPFGGTSLLDSLRSERLRRQGMSAPIRAPRGRDVSHNHTLNDQGQYRESDDNFSEGETRFFSSAIRRTATTTTHTDTIPQREIRVAMAVPKKNPTAAFPTQTRISEKCRGDKKCVNDSFRPLPIHPVEDNFYYFVGLESHPGAMSG